MFMRPTFPMWSRWSTLDEGVRIASNIVGIAPEEVTADMPVRVIFREATPEITLPVFEPA